MSNTLMGYTGYVGSTLLRQALFDFQYRSTNAVEAALVEHDLLVCAAAPAKKWIANSDPAADARTIDGLIDVLRPLRCKKFVLISTVDVFPDPVCVDEDSEIDFSQLQAYGGNRLRLERFVQEQFDDHLIIRLPGLVGPGLRKNAIFDFLNQNNLNQIDARGVFQFYPMVNLWQDIQQALVLKLRLLHLTAEPISVAEVARSGFGLEFEHILEKPPARYDMRSKYAEEFGGRCGYQYSARESLLAIRAYAQSEPRSPL